MLIPCSARSNTDNKMPWILTEGNSSRSNESWPLPPGIEVQRCKEQTNRNSTVCSCFFKFKSRVLSNCESIHFTNPAALCFYGGLTCAVYQGSHRARRARKSRKGRKGGGNHRRKRVKLRFASSCYCSFGILNFKPRHSSRSPKHTKFISCLTGTRLYSGAKRRSSCQRSQWILVKHLLPSQEVVRSDFH